MIAATGVNLQAVREAFAAAEKKVGGRIVVCAGTGCVANGSLAVYEALCSEIKRAGLDVMTVLDTHDDDQAHGCACGSQKHGDCGNAAGKGHADDGGGILLTKSGCQGFCQMGPLVTLRPSGLFYCRVTVADVAEIVERTLKAGEVVERLLYVEPGTDRQCRTEMDIPFYKRQSRLILRQCGSLDPENVNEYIARGGYESAMQAFTNQKPEEICAEVMASGLRGRGGGGFSTGRKWDLTRLQPSPKKYVICNGDEGDPGAFMDRSVMEGNPHSVIEGMMIAARAIGADEGYIYVRMEYPLAVKRLQRAVADAEALGILGDNVFGSGQCFRLTVMEGAGAFVCGEETALIASIEGQRGMPSPKPPFPAERGLWGKPTVINNVETLATVPLLMQMGAAAFRAIGTPDSPGTKTFALTGHVANTGLIEVPFGATLREIVFNIGGGVTDRTGQLTGGGFKAVQIGGPSGGCLTDAHLDLPLDFDSLRSIGAMVGSGGLVVMNLETCMVKVAHFFMQFTQHESCGKCVPCREGTRQMLAMLEDVIEGRATPETLRLLVQVAEVVQKGSLCGLGKTAPNPVLSTMKYFRDEYEAHVIGKRCPTRQCKALTKPTIDAALCKGCTLCVKVCPVGAISGERKAAHIIDDAVCVSCGACVEACKFKAIA